MPAMAEDIACQMNDGRAVTFTIDRNQFVAPQDAAEPPRRTVTTVQDGAATYPAEPFIIGPIRGYHAEGLGGSSVMFSVDATGTATSVNTRTGDTLTGICKVS